MARPLPRLDRLGRPQREWHRLFGGIEGALWLAERIPARKVPGAAWSLDADPSDPESHVAVVACPCRAALIVALLEPPQECECERWYFFDSVDLWVFNSPHDRTTVPVSVEGATLGRDGDERGHPASP